VAIYVLLAPVHGAVKIGYAADVSKRVGELQCGSPEVLKLLVDFPGNIPDERALHSRFAHLRIRGEWFRYGDELSAFVASKIEPMTDEQLAAIEKRNAERRELRSQTTPGEWLYESFAFVHAGEATLPARKRLGIVVRPRTWFHSLWDKYGTGILDEGLDPKDMQPYYDADWIAQAHTDRADDDVDHLVREVKRLRGLLGPTAASSERT
jgi:hypothetical protein